MHLKVIVSEGLTGEPCAQLGAETGCERKVQEERGRRGDGTEQESNHGEMIMVAREWVG